MGRVLILVQDAEAESLFLSFVQSVCPGDGVVLRLSLEQSLDYLQKREVPSYIILDIAGAADPVACVRDVTGMIPPSVTLMIIGDREDVNFYRTITHAFGVAEYLYRPLVENLVVRSFGAIILHGQKSRDTAHGGRLVFLTGVRDGVGVSTLLPTPSWDVAEVVNCPTFLVAFCLLAGTLGLLP